MREVRIPPIDENEIDTILAEDIDFSGVLTFKRPLMIKGAFQGEIKASSDLYVGDKAVVKAKIEANTVSNRGQIEGDVVAHSRVEFFATASMKGDLSTPELVMESGCLYNGKCNMSRDRHARKESKHES
ncbi:MAG: polymer-forming cytoskeletal protein [Spirochaetales bacterium]|nr:polymer-forming cytoskeletal protein [Spirochaetales bacterium]